MVRHFSQYFFVFIIICVVSCNNDAKRQTGNESGLNGYWYKRFKGTIAGQQVVVNLYCTGDSAAKGTYYYSGKSEILYLSLEKDHANPGHIKVTESVITDRNDDEDDTNDEDARFKNVWDIVFEGSGITGKFHKDKGAPTYDIILNEDYSGAVQLDYSGYNDSAIVKGSRWNGRAAAACSGVKPASSLSSTDKDFIYKSIYSLLTSDSDKITVSGFSELKHYQEDYVHDYLNGYKKDFAEWQSDTTNDPDPFRDYERYIDVTPVYNDRGLLVLVNQWYDYSGGAHGNHGASYINIDMKDHRIWRLKDIMEVSSALIPKLLAAEVRSKFALSPSQSLSEGILADTINASADFIISDKGITFCYDPYEIGSYAQGEINLFVPYTKLKPVLTEEFIKRWGL